VLRKHDWIALEFVELAARRFDNVSHPIGGGIRCYDADLPLADGAEKFGDVAGNGAVKEIGPPARTPAYTCARTRARPASCTGIIGPTSVRRGDCARPQGAKSFLTRARRDARLPSHLSIHAARRRPAGRLAAFLDGAED
jgi:hypothetical protein